MKGLKFTPTDVEIILMSSKHGVYVNDDQRIGFQKGAKWVRNELTYEKLELFEALKQAKDVIERTIVGYEWQIENYPTSLDKSDYEHIDEMRQALETINELGI